MNEEQVQMISGLNRCKFLPGSYEKRFVRDMATTPRTYQLTEKQTALLYKLYWRYRRQLIKIRAAGWAIPDPTMFMPKEVSE